MIYIYLVSYMNFDGSTLDGLGRVEITRNRKIKNIEDIVSIEETLHTKYGYKRVAVYNYVLMSKKIGVMNKERKDLC